MKFLRECLIFLFLSQTIYAHSIDELTEFREEIRESLEQDLVDVWYPRVVDEQYGGFMTGFDQQWKQTSEQDKFLVTQSRHIWTTIRLYEMYPEREELKQASEQGIRFIKEHFVNPEGGFYWSVNRNGSPVVQNEKLRSLTTYSYSFLIYALAAYADVAHDQEVRSRAIEYFKWLDDHFHDDLYGGYFNWNVTGCSRQDFDKRLFIKGQNTTIHLLEAFSELYLVWKDQLLKQRIVELRDIICRSMHDKRGFTKMYFDSDWSQQTLLTHPEIEKLGFTGIGNVVSFGHDVEIAYLLLNAQQVIDDEGNEAVRDIAYRLVEHSLRHGWDSQLGGLFESGKYVGEKCIVSKASKTWWVQAENLNALILLSYQFPEHAEGYLEKAFEQWEFIKEFQIDHQYRGWYDEVLGNPPVVIKKMKSHGWKSTYHNARALMNIMRMIETD